MKKETVVLTPNVVFWSVKTIREAQNLTQQDVADAAGIDRKTINRIEKGHHYPTLPVLFAIAIALDVHPLSLLDEDMVHMELDQIAFDQIDFKSKAKSPTKKIGETK